jgi:tetratricopeptide (TPR) repeat protein
MSFFGKLLGRRTAGEERERADALFANGELGLAKLAYERALSAAGPETDDVKQGLRTRIDACKDGLARARIAEAERLFADGARELAVHELEAAIETAASAEIIADAEQRIERTERREARAHAQLAEQSDDERFETIAGAFEDEQLDEYTAQGPELRAALLALYDGKSSEARPVLERLAQDNDEARYLWFEVGRVRLLDGDNEGGREALQRFVARLAPDEGGEARLGAHMELAVLKRDQGEVEAALAEYEAAVEALPDDPRPYLAMAAFLRREGAAADAVEVLVSAIDALGQEGHRQWRLEIELGLAHAALGQDDPAIEALEGAISYLTQRHGLDLPPEGAVPLAELHEKRGNRARALDLYNLLASGSDVANHFTYYRNAARLLRELDQPAEARRMLQRASELAPADPELRASLASELAELAQQR